MSTGGEDGFEDAKLVIREEIRAQFGEEVRLAFYEQGRNLDVHVVPERLESQLGDAVDGATVSRYSDLKFTVTRR